LTKASSVLTGSTQDAAELIRRAIPHERLSELGRRGGCRAVLLGTIWPEGSQCTAIGDDGAATSFVASEHVRVGCIAKLFTIALAARAAAAGHFELDTAVVDVLEACGISGRASLDGVTVAHLVNHTHGLDQVMTRSPPLLASGFIDIGALCESFESVPRLARPGQLYSYGDTGTRLLAAILERTLGKPYASMLHTELFEPLNMSDSIATLAELQRRGSVVCPAGGAELRVALADMLTFLHHQCRNPIFDRPWAAADTHLCPLPGWAPLEIGVYCGWKYYGLGWFGHHSAFAGLSVLIRLQPEARFGIVVASSFQPAITVAARLFGRSLPELANPKMPSPLGANTCRNLSPQRFIGRYRSAETLIRVGITRQERLEFSAFKCADGEGPAKPWISASLVPAKNDVFLLEPMHLQAFPIVQFVTPEGGMFQHLWNGRRVWKRETGHSPCSV
jgi:hypothetical protein